MVQADLEDKLTNYLKKITKLNVYGCSECKAIFLENEALGVK